jgi:hypothetical protein
MNCRGNQLQNLDVSNNISLEQLDCSQNLLTQLNISKNIQLGIWTNWWEMENSDLNISQMPTLGEVCVWDLPFPPESLEVNAEGSPNVYYTTECSSGHK